MKKITVWIFLTIIFLPISLNQVKSFTGIKFDVNLLGYSDSVQKPDLSVDTLLDGTFQSMYGTWTEENMPLRGVFTKTYNTIRYQAFRLGNRPIGNNGNIYHSLTFLCAALAIGEYDYSIPENEQKLQRMVDHMNSVNSKLKSIGKYLYVYIAPDKADIYPEDIPNNYLGLSEPNAVNVTDLFKEQMSATDVPYMICSDMADELEYPAFYKTGVHWSRTYEQLVTQKVISDLSVLSGIRYRNINIIGEAESSRRPFWRDSDVYNLLNVWMPADLDYYQYTVEAIGSESPAELNILLVGDSFAEGVEKDIKENIVEDAVYIINRNSFVRDPDGTTYYIDGNWDSFDWQSYLDRTDFVVIEMTEPEIVNYTYGFIDYLDSYLDSYTPMEKSAYYPPKLDPRDDGAVWNTASSAGVWEKSLGFAWIKPNCRIALNNKSISENGLEIVFEVPQQVLETEAPERVEIRINGYLAYAGTYTSPMEDKIIIKPDEFVPDENDNYIVTISCSQYFNPYVRGDSMDNRDLALLLIYIGGIRE